VTTGAGVLVNSIPCKLPQNSLVDIVDALYLRGSREREIFLGNIPCSFPWSRGLAAESPRSEFGIAEQERAS